MKATRVVLVAAAMVMALAACGSDGGDDGTAADTTVAGAVTTQDVTTTTPAATATSPCLSKDEMAALAGTPYEELKERENSAKKWPSGDCTYRWTSLNVETGFYIDVRNDAGAYYDQQVERQKTAQYREELPSPGVGDKSYMSRSTNDTQAPGLNSLLYTQRGPVYMSMNFSDRENKLKGSRDASIQLAIAIAKAQLAKVNA